MGLLVRAQRISLQAVLSVAADRQGHLVGGEFPGRLGALRFNPRDTWALRRLAQTRGQVLTSRNISTGLVDGQRLSGPQWRLWSERAARSRLHRLQQRSRAQRIGTGEALDHAQLELLGLRHDGCLLLPR